MATYLELIGRYGPNPDEPRSGEVVHATLTGYPDRISALQKTIDSLIFQVDTLHVFLNGFDHVPDFLDHDKIFVTRSQDFGLLDENGKYYWTGDLSGYHFICSDKLIYPSDYVASMIMKIEQHQRIAVISAGGYHLNIPFTDFETSADHVSETAGVPDDTEVPIINDLAVAFHSSSLAVSRHLFYQPELSGLWLSVIGQEQQVPFLCISHEEGWLLPNDFHPAETRQTGLGPDYRSFLVRSYFIPAGHGIRTPRSLNINDCFDRIYVMNLDRRPDRWRRITGAAEKHRLDLTRFPAVDGYNEPVKSAWEAYFSTPLQQLPPGVEPLKEFTDKFTKYHHYIARIHFMESKLGRKAIQSPGAYGYALSYISILKEAISRNYQRILIFDDDIILHKSFNSEFEKHFGSLPVDWKLIMLGAMQHNWDPWITRYSDLLYHCHGSSVASHAVGIDRKMFLPLLWYAQKLDLPVDEGAVFHVQNVYSRKCFVFLPNIAIQDMGESDISSSAMKQQDTERWMNLFRWNPEDYDQDLLV